LTAPGYLQQLGDATSQRRCLLPLAGGKQASGPRIGEEQGDSPRPAPTGFGDAPQLGPDSQRKRYSPEHRARRLERQLEALGYKISLEQIEQAEQTA
jgi:hypothetical protein